MTKQVDKIPANVQDSDRRSSVRVRSLLPCSVRRIEGDAIEALEARILDTAVVESDGIVHEMTDWVDRSEEISRDMLFVLNEMRALRQQLTEIQRVIEMHGKNALQSRWIELNDQGLWVPKAEGDLEWHVGDCVEIRLQIPSNYVPEILALGEVIRITRDDDEDGTAFRFRALSMLHKKAIMRYALRRERQVARSMRFTFNT